jgi:hypothetical protein
MAAAAEPNIARIDVITAADNPAGNDLAGGVQHALQQAWPGLSVTVHSSDGYQNNDAQTTIAIAVGDAALPWLNGKANFAGAIAFYVSSIAFNADDKHDRKITALYRDQPLSRQLRLAKLLLPHLQSAAIIHGSRPLPQSNTELQRDSDVLITDAVIDNQTEWPKLLSQLMRDNDVLLGIDDPQIYNSDTIRSVLLTTYRHGKVLIGPSRAFVNAGSLASCYTASDQYLQQLVAMVGAFLQDRKLMRPQYPKVFRVAINSQVAASLNLSIPDEKIISAWLQNQPGDCGNGC